MLKHGQVEAGAELGTLLTTRLSELKGQPDCPPPVPLLLPVFKAFPKDSPAHILRAWVKSAVSATATAANGQQGAPELHAAFAAHYATSQPPAYELAQRHLLRAQQPDQLVSLLRQWTGEAPLEERDLFIARAVFESVPPQENPHLPPSAPLTSSPDFFVSRTSSRPTLFSLPWPLNSPPWTPLWSTFWVSSSRHFSTMPPRSLTFYDNATHPLLGGTPPLHAIWTCWPRCTLALSPSSRAWPASSRASCAPS